MAPNHLIITLDGPAGAGKSTVAQGLAKRLGVNYLDTGAMYRAMTLKALRLKVTMADEEALFTLAKGTTISFQEGPTGRLHVTLDGEDVELDIRSVEVTNNTFYTARAPKVRDVMVGWQRAIAEKSPVVTDGRDQGTVVFPNASYKFYVDADFEERVQRRLRDLSQAGKTVDVAQLRADMKERDQKDFTRSVGPLKKAHDAIIIDSSGLSVDQTVEKIMKHIK
jgi:cytidylate kinase